MAAQKKKLAVFKLTSCDGCQLSLLDCEEELLTIAGAIEISYFPEATRTHQPGPYDLTLVEGSISTPEELERIFEIRKNSKFLITIGACATAGGIQGLRNFNSIKHYISSVYANPDYIKTLTQVEPVASKIKVDFELRGCPISKNQLLSTLVSFLNGRTPRLPNHSVCLDCKRLGVVCLAVTAEEACLGPVTQTGCNALCPSFNRPCFGCFGPKENTNTAAWSDWLKRHQGRTDQEVRQLFQQYTPLSEAFQKVSVKNDKKPSS